MVNTTVEAHLKLVNYVVNRFSSYYNVSPSFDRDDLVQEGYIGLMTAVKKFDPELGFAFSTFAVPTISGAILRFMRDKGPALKISRKYTMTERLISHAPYHLEHETPVRGTDKSASLMDRLPVNDDLSEIEFTVDLETKGLSDREMTVVKLRVAGKTQHEIARELNISQPSIGRILLRVARKLA